MPTPRDRAQRRLRERQRRVLYTWIDRVLTTGFWSSIAFIIAGVALAVVQREPFGDEVAPLPDVIPAVLDLSPQGIADVGILLLLFTPAAYTLVSLYIFARQRDRVFVVVCCALLSIVLVSVGLGLR